MIHLTKEKGQARKAMRPSLMISRPRQGVKMSGVSNYRAFDHVPDALIEKILHFTGHMHAQVCQRWRTIIRRFCASTIFRECQANPFAAQLMSAYLLMPVDSAEQKLHALAALHECVLQLRWEAFKERETQRFPFIIPTLLQDVTDSNLLQLMKAGGMPHVSSAEEARSLLAGDSGHLVNLRQLTLSNHSLCTLPPEVRHLINLREL